MFDSNAHALGLQAQSKAAQFAVYPQRWVVLWLFSLASFTNAFVWIMFSPVQEQSAQYFNTDSTGVNFFR